MDFVENIARFTNADNTIGLKFRVYAMVLESDVAGTGTAKANLPSTDFMINFKEAIVNDPCLENELKVREVLPTGSERPSDIFDYPIADVNGSNAPVTITGKQVRSSVANCPTETIVEYKARTMVGESPVFDENCGSYEWNKIMWEGVKPTAPAWTPCGLNPCINFETKETKCYMFNGGPGDETPCKEEQLSTC
jgi:hypothetical protein